jgi:hypothetical protein
MLRVRGRLDLHPIRIEIIVKVPALLKEGGLGRMGGERAPVGDATVTTSELYSVYCQAYADYDRSFGSAPRIAAPNPVARAIIEFAAEDAANGLSQRSRAQFEAAVQTGLEALCPLGLRAA